jgi:hypothetical protein
MMTGHESFIQSHFHTEPEAWQMLLKSKQIHRMCPRARAEEEQTALLGDRV